MSDRAGAVLFLLSSLRVGGSETKTVRLANSLAERNIEVIVAYLDTPAAPRPETLHDAIGPRVTAVRLERRGKLSLHALRRLLRVIRERRVHTLVSVNLYPALYARLAQLRLGASRLRFLAALNTTEIRTRKHALHMLLYRPALRGADLVIFGAEAQRRLWHRLHGIGAPGPRSRVIANGVDTDRFTPPRAAQRLRVERCPASRFVVGTVGQLRPEKAHIDLIRAVSTLRQRGLDVGALIVGEGRERAPLEAEIARLDVGSYVALAGEARDVRPFLASLDLFVVSSLSETFSNAALEALASGLPVVSSDAGGMPEALAFGGGVLYPRGDVERLAERIESLLEDPVARSRLADEARRAALEHFSWSGMVQAFVEILASAGSGAGMNFAPMRLDSP